MFALSFAGWTKPFFPWTLALVAIFVPQSVYPRSWQLKFLVLATVAGVMSRIYWGTRNGESLPEHSHDLASAVGMLLAVLQFHYFMRRSPLGSRSLIATFSIAWIVAILLFSTREPGYGIWKYSLAYPVTLLAIAMIDHLNARFKKLWTTTILLALSVVAISTGVRNLAASLALVGGIVFLQRRIQRKRQKASRTVPVVVIGGSIAFLAAFSAAQATGVFGASAAEKWKAQGGNIATVLAFDRPETFLALSVISQDPIHGYGLHGSLPLSTYSEALSLRSEADRSLIVQNLTEAVSAHSAIGDFWLRGGPIAAILPAAVLLLAVHALFRGLSSLRLTPLAAYSCVILCWDLLFSPWTYFSNIYWGALCAYILISVLDGPTLSQSGENVDGRGAPSVVSGHGNVSRSGRLEKDASLHYSSKRSSWV
jgi:hypothetical protein